MMSKSKLNDAARVVQLDVCALALALIRIVCA